MFGTSGESGLDRHRGDPVKALALATAAGGCPGASWTIAERSASSVILITAFGGARVHPAGDCRMACITNWRLT